MRINFYLPIKRHFLAIQLTKIKELYENEKGNARCFGSKFNTQNSEVMEIFCIQTWNQHIRINVEGSLFHVTITLVNSILFDIFGSPFPVIEFHQLCIYFHI
jgi:hypothetical protein